MSKVDEIKLDTNMVIQKLVNQVTSMTYQNAVLQTQVEQLVGEIKRLEEENNELSRTGARAGRKSATEEKEKAV